MFSFLYTKTIPDFKFWHWIESFVGLDGYFAMMRWGGAEYYQCGEWFLGCILILYLLYPLISYCANKFPKTTFLVTCLGYFTVINTVDNANWFFLKFPYLLLGIYFIKYFRTALSWKLWIPTIIAVILKFIFTTHMHSLVQTLIVCWTMFLLIALFVELFSKFNKYFSQEHIIKRISYVSILTFPIFLVHHKVITIMASWFDLTNFPYRYTVMLFICYITVVTFMSIYFMNLTKRVMQYLENKKINKE